MTNPNKLTGETVLEKLKYWHNEGEITLIRNRDLNRSYDVPILVSGIKFVDDMKWCMEELITHREQEELAASHKGSDQEMPL